MADGEKQQGSGGGRREMLRRMVEMLAQKRGDRTPVTGGDLAEALLPVIGAVGSYADDFHGAKHEVDGVSDRFKKMDAQERRARNSQQFLSELNDSKDKEAVSKAWHFIAERVRSKFKDRAEADEKLAAAMDDLVDNCNKNKISVLEAVCNAAKDAGFTVEESRDVAAKAVEGTPSEHEGEGTEKAVDAEKEDKPLTRADFERSSDEEAKGAAAKDKAPAETAKAEDEETGGNPDAEEVISRARNPHESNEGSRKGEPDPDEMTKLANSSNPADRAKYKRALGY